MLELVCAQVQLDKSTNHLLRKYSNTKLPKKILNAYSRSTGKKQFVNQQQSVDHILSSTNIDNISLSHN